MKMEQRKPSKSKTHNQDAVAPIPNQPPRLLTDAKRLQELRKALIKVGDDAELWEAVAVLFLPPLERLEHELGVVRKFPARRAREYLSASQISQSVSQSGSRAARKNSKVLERYVVSDKRTVS